MFYIILVILIALDQLTKYFIDAKMYEGDTIPIINNFFHLTYVQNRGVAFGAMQGKFIIINIVSISAVIFMIIYAKRNYLKNPKIENFAWMFIIAGALGNILDRIFRGFVVDMMDFRGIWGYIFNFADVYINIGVFLMIMNSLFQERAKKRGGNTK